MLGSCSRPILDFRADMVTVADFDLDGCPEFAVGRRSAPQLLVWAEDASRHPTSAQIELETAPVALASADFNGDGVPELAVALDNANVQFLVADARLNFSLSQTVSLPEIACDLEVRAVGSDVSLIVATAAGIHRVHATAPDTKISKATSTVQAAEEHPESIRSRRRIDLHFPDMTARERDVVMLALTGLTAKQIGVRLFIGARTVETHLAHAYNKLGIRSRFELVARHRESRA